MSVPNEMILEQFQIGPLENYLYFLGDKTSNEIAIVDPAWDVNFLCKKAAQNGYKVTAIFLTHGHTDHVNGLDAILKQYDVPVYISKHESPFYKPEHKNIIEVEDHEKLKVGNIAFECILAPGHTPGCQCFKYEEILIAGDVLFIDGCGRCDLPGGDAKVMYNSLYNIIMNLPDTTIIYPGHNYGPTPFATLKSQKETNPYLTCQSEKEFLMHRMGIGI